MKKLRIDVEEDPVNEDYTVTQSGTFKKGMFAISDQWDGLRYEDLKQEVLLGQGSSGVVYRAVHKHRPDLTLALKDISVCDPAKRQQIVKELEALHTARCPYLVGFFGAFYIDGSISLALEYMEGGSLKDICDEIGKIDEPVLSLILFQVLLGLKYLHRDRHMVHRDIKPCNILMNKNGEFKITDFGVSTELENTFEKCVTFVGTVTYMSPERLVGERYSYASDIWSLGISALECATGGFPFLRDDGTAPVNGFWELLNHIKTKEPPALRTSDGYSPELCDFVARCLAKDPGARPSAVDLLGHPFITKYVPREFPHRMPDVYVEWANKVLNSAERRNAKMSLENESQKKENLLSSLKL